MARRPKTPPEQPGTTPSPPDAEPVAEASSPASPTPEPAETPVETVTPPPATPRRSGFGVIVGTIVAVLLLGAAATASWPLWAPRLAALIPVTKVDPFTDSRMVGMADRLAVVEQRLETSPGGDLIAMAARIDDLAAAQRRLSADVQALTKHVDEVRRSVETAPAADDPGEREADAALASRLQTLEQTVQTLLARPNDTAARPAELDAIQARNRELAESVAKLSGRIEQMTSQEQAEKQAEARAEAAASPRLELAAAVAGLRHALSSSGPYRPELSAVQGALSGSGVEQEMLTALTARASQGIPTLATLRSRFETVAKEVIRADRTSGGDGWLERAIDRVKGLITIRRTDGGADSGDVDAVVSRAETALASDDLRSAAGALEGLQGAPAAAARNWLSDAQARLGAERALTALDARVARPAPAGGGA